MSRTLGEWISFVEGGLHIMRKYAPELADADADCEEFDERQAMGERIVAMLQAVLHACGDHEFSDEAYDQLLNMAADGTQSPEEILAIGRSLYEASGSAPHALSFGELRLMNRLIGDVCRALNAAPNPFSSARQLIAETATGEQLYEIARVSPRRSCNRTYDQFVNAMRESVDRASKESADLAEALAEVAGG